jgi:hypothetical protein
MMKQFLFLAMAIIHFTTSCTNPSPSVKASSADRILISSNNKPIDSSKIISNNNKKIEEEEYNFDQPISAAAYEPRDDSFPTFNRTIIANKLKNKISKGEALVVHIFVPLCDNEHQGIVRTSESLGNGFSLTSNLYWATRNGMKRYFNEKSNWTLLKSIKNVYKDSVVLERVVFERNYPNNATVYIVADAYRGDKMFETVNDFLRASSNNYTEVLTLSDSQSINIHGGADMVVFNGHNGQLDLFYNQPNRWFNTSKEQKDMVVIACYANEYFEREAMRAKAYPIVRAKNTLHPGAFVISNIIDEWAMLRSVEEMSLSAGKAYCAIHNCSAKTSRNLFYKGWKPENLERTF